ncbi:hypothetical protein AAW51_0350 [Caldimonas brevitalea]|uniref:Uncharacterized protein n=2 Tax=Caldimonas brevitalea TaxID=413882 RepID=A0A0G3BI52_9BURK|nr:hypothetical protein AAW51_0350 [Caldimonas brevitalea]
MGHDPSPWIERVGESYVLWPDEGISQSQREEACIFFGRDVLTDQLSKVLACLQAFSGRIVEVAGKHVPGFASDLEMAFRNAFASPATPIEA